MASLVVAGDVSGSVTLSAPSAAGSTVITLPTTSGTMVVTGGAQTVQFAAGSASTPSITFTGDTNTGIFSPAADTIAFSEGGVESMRIDSSGNLNMSTVGGKVNFATTSSATVNYIGVPADGFSLELACQRGASQPFVYKLDFANGHIWSTAGSERMRIASGGNVGIAASNPQSGLEIYRANSTTGSLTDASLMLSTTATTGRKVNIGFGLGGGVANTCAAVIGYDVTNGSGAGLGDIFFSTRSTTADSTPTERMRIDSSGNLLVNRTSTFSAGQYCADYNGNTQRALVLNNSTSVIGANIISFASGGSVIASITQTGASQVTYSTSSDYRLKENIAPMTGALEKVAQLKPVTYTWKSDGSAGQGFIAHELQAVVPDAVTGEKDAVELVDIKDEDGNVVGQEEKPAYQGVDTSFLVATLTAAIQELNAKVEAQAAEIAALKGAN